MRHKLHHVNPFFIYYSFLKKKISSCSRSHIGILYWIDSNSRVRSHTHSSHFKIENVPCACCAHLIPCQLYPCKTLSIIHVLLLIIFDFVFFTFAPRPNITHMHPQKSNKMNTIPTLNWISNGVRAYILQMFRSFFIFFVCVLFTSYLSPYKCKSVLCHKPIISFSM